MSVYTTNSILQLLEYFSANDRVLPNRIFNTMEESILLDAYRDKIRALYDNIHGQIFKQYEDKLKEKNIEFPQDDDGNWNLEGYTVNFDIERATELLAQFAAYVVYLAQGYRYRVEYEDNKPFPIKYAISSILNLCSYRNDLKMQANLLQLLSA